MVVVVVRVGVGVDQVDKWSAVKCTGTLDTPGRLISDFLFQINFPTTARTSFHTMLHQILCQHEPLYTTLEVEGAMEEVLALLI